MLIHTRLISFVIIRLMRAIGSLKACVTAAQTLPRNVVLLIMSHAEFKVYDTGLLHIFETTFIRRTSNGVLLDLGINVTQKHINGS